MKKQDFIALLLEDSLTDEVRIMSSAENIDEFDNPEDVTSVSDRVVAVNNGAVEGLCLVLTNAPAKRAYDEEEN